MEQINFFPYSWHVADNDDMTEIRIYALNEANKSVCITVNDFCPYVYIELPESIEWNQGRANMVRDKLKGCLGKSNTLQECNLVYKKRLYYANLDEDKNPKLFPYLFCSFTRQKDIKNLFFRLKEKIQILGIGIISMKMHEQDASPVLQICCKQNIPTASWIKGYGRKVAEENKITYCDLEFIIKHKNLTPFARNIVAKPLIMGFDIEVNSSNPSAFPKAHKPGDKVFQISCVMTREGGDEKDYVKYLLSLGSPCPDKVGADVNIYAYETESDLLVGFSELIQELNPNVIVGYNILGFDIPYMIDRAKFSMCINEFSKQGFHVTNMAKEKTIKWSSSAFKNQEFQYLDAEGRLFVDLMPLVQRDYKLDNYQLKTVSQFFLGDTKADLSAKGIFKCYKIGMQGGVEGSKALGVCGAYCVQDTMLVVKLMEKLQIWVGLAEMAVVCNVQLFTLYTQGQQIKVYSQLYKHCYENNTVVEKDVYETKETDRYLGAHVFDPIPGIYDSVVSLDFCLSGDTLVTCSNGVSKKIKEFDVASNVFGYKGEGLASYGTINGLQRKGLKETVKIYLEDGRSIISTPDHKFMLDDNTWCEAKDLISKTVIAGIEYAEDCKYEDEDGWSLEVEGYTFTMKDDKEREMTLCFARMLGYILADGSVYTSESLRYKNTTRKFVEVCFGTKIDAQIFKTDMLKICDKDVLIRERTVDKNNSDKEKERSKKGSTYCLATPRAFSEMIHSLEDIVIGKRATQRAKLPKFVLDKTCPLSVVKQFLSGLYGGDGSAPCLLKTKNLNNICLNWTTIEKHVSSMVDVFSHLKLLHNRLGIDVVVYEPTIVKYGTRSIVPKDIAENPRYSLQINITLEDTTKFADNIGFSYCINKAGRLTVASSYFKMGERTRLQYKRVLCRTNELINIHMPPNYKGGSRRRGDHTYASLLEIAREELLKDEPAVNAYSLASTQHISYQRYEAIRHEHKRRKLSLQSKLFPKAMDYIKHIGAEEWFSYTTKRVYAVKGDSSYIPCYKQRVVDVRPNGFTEVFDIEVDGAHNFLANGIVSHNCSMYPSTIIAYNIDYSTLVLDPDVPDKDCHVMDFHDHLSCKHDPKIIRTNEITSFINEEKEKQKKLRDQRDKIKDKKKKAEIIAKIDQITLDIKPYQIERTNLVKSKAKVPMCEKRYYRFLKHPKGILPTVIQNLLDARKETRTQIKELKSKIKNCTDKEEVEHDLLLITVLDKRQLAFKTSANSMYGIMGVKRGLIPFMCGAMCTTFKCRENIQIVAKVIPEKFCGQLIYGEK